MVRSRETAAGPRACQSWAGSQDGWWDLVGSGGTLSCEDRKNVGARMSLQPGVSNHYFPSTKTVEQGLLNLELWTSHTESQKHEKTHQLRTKPPGHFLKCHPGPPRPAPPGDSGRTTEL